MKNQNNANNQDNTRTLTRTILIGIIAITALVFGISLLKNNTPANRQIPQNDTPNSHESAQPQEPYSLLATWQWEKRTYNGSETVVETPSQYTLTFKENDVFNAQLDCNSGGGSYTSTPLNSVNTYGSIEIKLQTSTMAYCGETSKDRDMIKMMAAAQNYRIEDNGNTLIFVWPASGPYDYYTKVEK